MLLCLSIRNIILIEAIDIDFRSGLTSVIGDSGAGKSIILESISIILGSRAEQSLIRIGQDQALIQASFKINQAIQLKLMEYGYESMDEIIIKKIINRGSGSKIFINDIPTTVNFISRIAPYLIEIHTQMEQMNLLSKTSYIEIVDNYQTDQDLTSKVKNLYTVYSEQKQKMENMLNIVNHSKSRLIELKEMQEDIEVYNILENEEMNLVHKRISILNNEDIFNCVNNLNEDIRLINLPKMIVFLQKKIASFGEKLSQELGEELNKICNNIEEANTLLESAENDLGSILAKTNYDADALNEVEERIQELNSVARKYKVPSSALYDLVKNIDDEIMHIENSKIELKKLQNDLLLAEEEYLKYAKELSLVRKKKSKELSKDILKCMHLLRLDNARFEIQIEDLNHYSDRGIDNIQFMFSANTGIDLQPIYKVASGGELSRITLAIKVCTSSSKDCQTVIFDEIESGMSGNIASATANEIKRLSQKIQVICITHNHHIANLSDNHIKIVKNTNTNLASSIVYTLTTDEAKIEIEKMIG